MGRKAENTMRIKELEEELSEERIAEHFRLGEQITESAEYTRLARRTVTRSIIIALIFVIVLIATLQYYNPRIVNEKSMEDTLGPKDCVVLAIQAYDKAEVKYGDMIMVETLLLDEKGQSRDLIKRVIGLPGDTVAVRGGSVYRNGELLHEPYTKDGFTDGEMAPQVVPENGLFLLGDNRQISIDSRDARVGYVDKDQIIGKVVFRLLPLSRIGIPR